MILMTVMGLLLVVGVVLTMWWGGTTYRQWQPTVDDVTDRISAPNARPPIRTTVLRYLRGVAIALVGGVWAGALITGPAVRLIMRLLAVTAGDDAQGRITEADEVVGRIELDGTIGLYIFAGVLPGLLSGAIYVLIRRFLPGGRVGGIVFGALHLVIAATRLDPLRPDNPDFDLVGPGWLSVTTFGLTCVFHGMAVAAIANRYSTALPPDINRRATWIRALLPLPLPALFALVPSVAVALVAGLALTVAVSRIAPAVQAAHSRGALVAGRIVVCVAALGFLPGTIIDLRDVIVRDDPAAVADKATGDSGSVSSCHRPQSNELACKTDAGRDPSPGIGQLSGPVAARMEAMFERCGDLVATMSPTARNAVAAFHNYEFSTRIRQLDYLLERATRHSTKAAETLATDPDTDPAEVQLAAITYTECFYLVAWRLRVALTAGGNPLGTFDPEGVNRARNLLFEHPEHGGPPLPSWALGGGDVRLSIGGAWNDLDLPGYEPGGWTYQDPGLLANAEEFRSELEALLLQHQAGLKRP